MEWRTSLPNYWFDLVILDFTNGSKSEERIVVEAGSADEAYDDLCFYLDNVYPEDEFEVDVYPYYDDESDIEASQNLKDITSMSEDMPGGYK